MARTRAEDFDAKRRAILTSAAAVFADQGMEKASMARIAAQSGVSKSLLYHYYPSKAELIFSIIHTHLEELDAAIATADDPELPPEARLRALVRAVIETYRDAADQHKVQLNAGPVLGEAEKAEILVVERRIVRRFSAVLAVVNPALGEGDGRNLMPVTMSLFGMMNWVDQWFREGGPVSRADYADLATTLILDGVRAVR
ncbi:TetR/AcrR family transcriptional regulator [Defluviimonas sp. D31]|uniref:TetR/AcrR family transcriptional regulator n=1 Tax=Defluviimonas sp. D31 TaxID=3083253 RepID=UPI00296ED290|nr:TetR/AcrR family transcriptional regulator [Defluviimonas sp. D31]MDW4548982.1 TetR/AcrR family transcriptional regulator [Defluviimonas sp. D31]